jgi:hypothetical protein
VYLVIWQVHFELHYEHKQSGDDKFEGNESGD